MDIEKRNKLISIVLGVIIIFLGYFLYDSIVTPYQIVIEREQMTEKVRTRMSDIRDALVRYESQRDSFPDHLDSLVARIRTDSLMRERADSTLAGSMDGPFNADSLLHSPRTGKRFLYTLNDTLRPPIYLLQDPDTEDNIGDTLKTTQLNAASWE